MVVSEPLLSLSQRRTETEAQRLPWVRSWLKCNWHYQNFGCQSKLVGPRPLLRILQLRTWGREDQFNDQNFKPAMRNQLLPSSPKVPTESDKQLPSYA